MKEKIWILLAVSVVAYALTACSKPQTENTSTPTTESTTEIEVTASDTEQSTVDITVTPVITDKPASEESSDDTQTSTPTTAIGTEVSLTDTDIPGNYWREENLSIDSGWSGGFIVINSDGTVYQWAQANADGNNTFAAEELKVTKVTTYSGSDYSDYVTHLIFLNNESGKPLYYGKDVRGVFIAYESDFEKDSFYDEIGSVLPFLYIPDNVVFE